MSNTRIVIIQIFDDSFGIVFKQTSSHPSSKATVTVHEETTDHAKVIPGHNSHRCQTILDGSIRIKLDCPRMRPNPTFLNKKGPRQGSRNAKQSLFKITELVC